MPFCAAATACNTPGACTEHVAPGEIYLLATIIFLPIVVSLALPRMHRWTTSDGPSPHARGASSLCCSMLPLPCVASGYLIVTWLLTAAVVPFYFMLLMAPLPCATALGACGTISCAAGNDYFEGYVFMFVVLGAAGGMLVRDVATTVPAGGLRDKLLCGALCVVFTGIYPEHFGRARTRRAGSAVLYHGGFALHVLGLVAPMACFVWWPYHMLIAHYRAHGRASILIDWRTVLRCRTAHVLCLVGYAVAFFARRTLPDDSDYCAPFAADPAGCHAWPNLNVSACNRLATLASSPAWRTVPTGNVVPSSYRCRYVEAKLGEAADLLLPPSAISARAAECLKSECALFPNACSIALEFGLLLLVAAYTGTYALPDVRWVLEQREARAARDRVGGDPLLLSVHPHVDDAADPAGATGLRDAGGAMRTRAAAGGDGDGAGGEYALSTKPAGHARPTFL